MPRSDFTAYVDYRLSKSADEYFSIFDAPPLFVASRPPLHHTGMITLLLESGQDPNETSIKIRETTPWLAFVHRVACWNHGRSGSELFPAAVRSRLFSAFLTHGADPNALHARNGATVIAMFLLAAEWHRHSFRRTSSRRPSVWWAEAYFQTLDDFLEAGASLDLRVPVDLKRISLRRSKAQTPA